MTHEIELISDGDGIAVIGDSAAVDRFLSSAGVESRDLDLQRRLGTAYRAGSMAAQAGSEIAANGGRWVKLTEQSAKAMQANPMMTGSSKDVVRAIVTTGKGKTKHILEIVKPGSVGSMLTNPAMLAGAAGVMAQLAMQQAMDEITDYLAVIDEKVDDILRAQKDAALAEMIGVGFVLDEAMAVRDHTGRVSEVTWSKVQAAPQAIAATQGYAIRQLDALAEKLEKKSKVGDLAGVVRGADVVVGEWLAVLARCFQLQDGLTILELDRVLDSSPDEIDRHRLGLRHARDKRRAQIADATARLLQRMDVAAGRANADVLLHPLKAGAVIRATNEIGSDVVVFQERLGIAQTRDAIEAKKWGRAVEEKRDRAIDVGEDGVEMIKRAGARTYEGARAATDRAARALGDRMRRRGNDSPRGDEEP